MNPLQDRLQTFLNFTDTSMRAFERQCGIKAGTAAKMTENSYDTTFHKISIAYPMLNLHWLKTGEGSMINQHPDVIINDSSSRSGGDNAKEIKKAGRDFYEEPCQEDKVIIEALTKEVEYLTALLAEKEQRINNLEQDLLRKDKQMSKKDEQMDRLITLLEKK